MKTAARDLSKSLGPKSEEKAKQLILKYANKEDLSGRGTPDTDLYMEQSTPCQASVLTDSDDSPHGRMIASKSYSSSKKHVFGKLLKLIRGHSQLSSQEDIQAEENVPFNLHKNWFKLGTCV